MQGFDQMGQEASQHRPTSPGATHQPGARTHFSGGHRLLLLHDPEERPPRQTEQAHLPSKSAPSSLRLSLRFRFRFTLRIYASYSAPPASVITHSTHLTQVWGVWQDREDFYLRLHRPDIRLAGGTFTVGRVALSVAASDALTASHNTKFAHTGHTLRLLERAAACVAAGEPVLLVGDTGTGKTSTIQYMADVLREKLVVLVS